MAEGRPTPRAAIRARQLDRIRALLAEILPANQFYAHKLAGDPAGWSAIASLEEFSRRVPFTTKNEVAANQIAHPPYGTNLTFSLPHYTRYHHTSGTTGTPIRWLDSPESWEAMVESWSEILRAASVRPGDQVVFAFSFGPFIGFWLGFEAATRLGALCVPAGGLSSVGRLRLILDLGAQVLCCTPTYALHLGEVAAAHRISLTQSPVRTLIVAGEPGGSIPAMRARLEQMWPGVRVFDHHGMTEVGPVSHECPAGPGRLHVLESAYYAEVVEPQTGEPARPGATGELVLTTLGRLGMPLLRYRTGDLVKLVFSPAELGVAPCACGRSTLVLEGGILGRVDDMVIVRGVNIFPGAVEQVIREFPEVAEYQVVIRSVAGLTEMGVRLEPVNGAADARELARRVQDAFQTAFALRTPIEVVPPGTLPRFEMKARRWVRE